MGLGLREGSSVLRGPFDFLMLEIRSQIWSSSTEQTAIHLATSYKIITMVLTDINPRVMVYDSLSRNAAKSKAHAFWEVKNGLVCQNEGYIISRKFLSHYRNKITDDM